MNVVDVNLIQLIKIVFPNISKWFIREKSFNSEAAVPKSMRYPSEQNVEGPHIRESISAANAV